MSKRALRARFQGSAAEGPCAFAGAFCVGLRLDATRRRARPRTGSGSTPSASASAVPRAVVIGTSISSASSQVAKTASPKTRRSATREQVDEPQRHVDRAALPPATRGRRVRAIWS